MKSLFFYVLLSLIITVYSDDGKCFNDFLAAHPSIVSGYNMGYDSSTGQYNYCGVIATCNGANITQLSFSSTTFSMSPSETPIDNTLISCMSLLTRIYISNIPVVSDLIYNINLPNLNTFSCYNCSIKTIDQMVSLPSNSYFSLTEDFNSILLSTIINIQTVYLNPLSASSMGPLIINDLTPSNYNTSSKLLSGWSIVSNYFPDFSNLYVDNFVFRLYSNNFDFSTMDNLKNASFGIFQFDFSKLTTSPQLPVQVSDIILYNIMWLTGPFGTPSTYFDFSKASTLNILNTGPLFNINGSIPFSKFPISLYASNCQFDKFPTSTADGHLNNMNIQNSFTSLTTLPSTLNFTILSDINISNNNISGSIPESACSYIGYRFTLTNNKLSGDLPACVTCYWDYFSTVLAGNSFNAFTPSATPCSSIDFNITAIFDGSTLYYQVDGTDLTFIDNNILPVPYVGYISKLSGYKFLIHANYISTLQSSLTLNFTIAPRGLSMTRNVSVPAFKTYKTSRSQSVSNVISITGFPFPSTVSSVLIGSQPGSSYNLYNQYYTLGYYIYDPTSLPSKSVVSLTFGEPNPPFSYLIDTTIGAPNNLTCSEDCLSKNQLCDYSIGTCVNYDISLSSVKECTENGGPITLYGDFGTSNNNLVVTINNNVCTAAVVINSTQINCTLPAGSGRYDIVLQQNGLTWTFAKSFKYQPLSFTCPLNCSNHGTCDNITGQCSCNSDYQGLSCSVPSSPSSSSSDGSGHSTPVTDTNTDDNGNTVISNGNTSFRVYLYSIREISYLGDQVKEFLFDQSKMTPSSVGDVQYLYQDIDGANLTLSYQVYNETTPFEFAGVTFNITKGSVKVSVSINNWGYDSSLNHLQVLFNSTSTTSYITDCEKVTTTKSKVSYQSLDQYSYYAMEQEGVTLQGRFIDRVLSDGRSTSISGEIITDDSSSSTSVLVALDLPHCQSCLMDPDFSVLIDTSATPKSDSTSDGCGDSIKSTSSSSKKWKVPVIVVAVVLGSAIIIGVSYVVYKKYTTGRYMSNLKNKLNSFNQ